MCRRRFMSVPGDRRITMSLKTFHVVFVLVCTVLALGFGAWAIRSYRLNGETDTLIAGIGSFLGAIGLLWYGRWFLHKLRGIS